MARYRDLYNRNNLYNRPSSMISGLNNYMPSNARFQSLGLSDAIGGYNGRATGGGPGFDFGLWAEDEDPISPNSGGFGGSGGGTPPGGTGGSGGGSGGHGDDWGGDPPPIDPIDPGGGFGGFGGYDIGGDMGNPLDFGGGGKDTSNPYFQTHFDSADSRNILSDFVGKVSNLSENQRNLLLGFINSPGGVEPAEWAELMGVPEHEIDDYNYAFQGLPNLSNLLDQIKNVEAYGSQQMAFERESARNAMLNEGVGAGGFTGGRGFAGFMGGRSGDLQKRALRGTLSQRLAQARESEAGKYSQLLSSVMDSITRGADITAGLYPEFDESPPDFPDPVEGAYDTWYGQWDGSTPPPSEYVSVIGNEITGPNGTRWIFVNGQYMEATG